MDHFQMGSWRVGIELWNNLGAAPGTYGVEHISLWHGVTGNTGTHGVHIRSAGEYIRMVDMRCAGMHGYGVQVEVCESLNIEGGSLHKSKIAGLLANSGRTRIVGTAIQQNGGSTEVPGDADSAGIRCATGSAKVTLQGCYVGDDLDFIGPSPHSGGQEHGVFVEPSFVGTLKIAASDLSLNMTDALSDAGATYTKSFKGNFGLADA
jgi:hypothetical protein